MQILNAVNKDTILINKTNYPIFNDNYQKGQLLGDIQGIVCHWTACDRDQFFNGYHTNIGQVGNEVVVVKTLSFKQKGQHLFGRNTGMVGVTLCAMYQWKVLPTEFQLDIMALYIAELCAWKKLNPEDKISLPEKKLVNNNLVNTGKYKDFNLLSDHREFAESDGYGSQKQDIKDYMIPMRKKAIQYYKELKATKSKREFKFTQLFKE